MSAPDPRSPVERRPPRREPVEMSAAEKLACEWEARHDVVGRRRIGDIAPIQHYLAQTRSEGGRRTPEGTEGHPHPAPRSSAHRGHASSALRSWLRWGEDGGPDNPVIPRC